MNPYIIYPVITIITAWLIIITRAYIILHKRGKFNRKFVLKAHEFINQIIDKAKRQQILEKAQSPKSPPSGGCSSASPRPDQGANKPQSQDHKTQEE